MKQKNTAKTGIPKESKSILPPLGAPRTKIIDRIKAETPKKGFFEIDVDRDIAHDMLLLNYERNRAIDERYVQEIVDQMIAGEWEENGDTISFTKDIKLFDGQNRLWSIFISGKAQRYIIKTGLNKKAVDTKDINKPRTGSDVLYMMGFDDTNQLTPAVRAIIWFEKHRRVAANINWGKVTNRAITRWTRENATDRLAQYVKASKGYHQNNKVLTRSHYAMLNFVLSERGNVTKANEFIEALAMQKDLAPNNKNSAIYALSKELNKIHNGIDKNTSYTRKKLLLTLKFKYIIEAWGLWLTGWKGDRIKLSDADRNSETLPTPKRA